MEHRLRTKPEYFKAVLDGIKTFEVRNNDRNFKVGDILILREYDKENYTMRHIEADVTYILPITIGDIAEYVVLSIDVIEKKL